MDVKRNRKQKGKNIPGIKKKNIDAKRNRKQNAEKKSVIKLKALTKKIYDKLKLIFLTFYNKKLKKYVKKENR